MSDLEWGELQDKIDELPQDLADFLVDYRTSNFIRNLTINKKVDPRLGTEIAAIVRDVIVADLYIDDLPTIFRDRLGISQDLAYETANEVVSQLFPPIIEGVKKIQRDKLGSRMSVQPQRPLETREPPSLHEQNVGNVVDLRGKK